MSDSREKTMRLTRIALLIAMNCISAYLIIPLPFFPVADSLADAHRQPGRPPAAAERRSHHHAGLYRIGLIGVPVFTGVRPDLARCSARQVATSGPTSLRSSSCPGSKGRTIVSGATPLGSRRHRHPGHLSRRCPAAQRRYRHAWEAAIMSGVVPFIPLDIVKSLCAAALARPLLALGLKGTQG